MNHIQWCVWRRRQLRQGLRIDGCLRAHEAIEV